LHFNIGAVTIHSYSPLAATRPNMCELLMGSILLRQGIVAYIFCAG
jgi:hypothetical protein